MKASMCGIPSFDRRCRVAKDNRGLHSGGWFIAQGMAAPRRSTAYMAVIVIAIAVGVGTVLW